MKDRVMTPDDQRSEFSHVESVNPAWMHGHSEVVGSRSPREYTSKYARYFLKPLGVTD